MAHVSSVLKSESAGVRFYACEALQKLGCSRSDAGTRIATLLRDRDATVRSCALKTLIELRKLELSMLPQLEAISREDGFGWVEENRGIALYGLWLLRPAEGEAKFKEFLLSGTSQGILWPVCHLKTRPELAQTIMPVLSQRAEQCAGTSLGDLLQEAISEIRSKADAIR